MGNDASAATHPEVAQTEGPPAVAPRSVRNRRIAVVTRWLHIYVSMLAFTIVFFFSVTGFTLNHAEWFFGDDERLERAQGTIDPQWLDPVSAAATAFGGQSDPGHPVDKLEIVEYLRRTHDIRGALADFTIEDEQCAVAFKGPGYASDALIDRRSGAYEITQTRHGLVAILNDLHKGRDTGATWAWVIDVSAILTAFISLTGLILLFYLKQRRTPGLVVAVIGTIIVIALFRLTVP
jgi:hypothetical protein